MSLSSPAHPSVASAMPLPPDVVVHASWFGRARQFPIFGGAWFRYRSIAFLSGLLVTALLIAAMAAIPLQPKDVDWIDVLQVGAVFVTPCVVLVLVGPALAVWVRARGWPVRRELAGILCALLLGMAASVAAGFQLKDWYESARVDSSGTRVIRLLPRVQFSVNWQAGPKVVVDQGTPWHPLSPEEQAAFDTFSRAVEALGRFSPRVGPDAGDGFHLTPQETADMDAYLKLKTKGAPLTPAQEKAARPGRAAFEKLLRHNVELATGRAGTRPAQATPTSAAYLAAQKKYDETRAAFMRVRQRHDPAATSPVPASASGSPSSAGIASTVFVLLALILLVCWLGGLTDLVAFVRQRGKLDDVLRDQALRRADAARAEAELRLSVLAAQVEPHFLFNTLALIGQLIETDPKEAARVHAHLIDYLRSTLPQMRQRGGATLGKQVELSRAYLAIMQARMKERLQVRFDVPDFLGSAPFPPMMLQTLIENAIKHGLEPKIEGGTVAVRAHVVGADLHVEVCDDGVGIDPHADDGVGLANIRERLQLLYGAEAALDISTPPGGGACATIRLPYKMMEDA